MKKEKIVFRMSLLQKLALIAALFVGGESSVWAQKSLPYSYGFENNNLAGEGWTTSQAYSLTKVVSSSDYGSVFYSGSYSFRFYYNNSYAPQYLISPQLESSVSGIDVSFYYTCNNGSDKVKFKVGVSTTNTEPSSFTWGDEITVAKDVNWHLYSNSFSDGVKYLAIQFTATDYRLYIDDISIDISETYKRPKNLLVNSVTDTSADLSWTNGSDESAWQIAYSTKEDFNPDTEGVKVDVTTNPYTLTGLTDGVTYYAYVRSNYGGNFSAWSNKVETKPVVILLLNNGTTTNTYLPVYNNTYYASMGSQYVIPADNLTSIQNRQIKKLTFYSKEQNIKWDGATFDVYLAYPETATYASSNASLKDWGTKVVSEEEFIVVDGELVISFDTPFHYYGGNLLIGIQRIAATSSSVSSTWYGVNEENYTAVYYSKYGATSTSSNYPQKFSPKVTIETVSSTIPVTLGARGYTTFACPRPLDLTNLPSGLKAYKAAVNGDKVKFTEINQAVPANTGMLLEGTAGETYFIPVADSGTAPEGNEFLVNSTGGTFAAVDGYTYYGLLKDSDPLTFGTFVPSSVAIPTNKAYLKVADADGTSRLSCFFYNDTQGISEETVVAADRHAHTIYNLAGQQVAQPVKGLYIINGKKQIIK